MAPAASRAALSTPTVASFPAILGRLADYVELTKPRISVLVLLVTAVGFCLGSVGGIDPLLLAHTLIGTALVAAGANTLNQYLERRFDRLMRRTANRPIPAGRISGSEAKAFGSVISAAGGLYLLLLVNWPATLLAAATSGLYLFVYTPLKRRTIYNTMIGAVPGALPPLIGFAAAHGGLAAPGWALFAVLFVWQLPHFFAIAWVYREDYERGGYRMLPSADRDGSRTGRWVVGYSIVLGIVSLFPAWLGTVGAAYLVGATVLGLGLLAVGIGLARGRSTGSARLMVAASVVYLPALMILLLVDRMGA